MYTREDTQTRMIELPPAGVTENRCVRRPLRLSDMFDLFDQQSTEQSQRLRP